MKKKNYIIISIDIDLFFDKIQYLFITNYQKTGTRKKLP